MSWFYQLLGLDSSTEILDLKVSFAYPIPAWVVIFLLLGVLIFVWRLYRNEGDHLSKAYKTVLAIVRYCAWCLLILLVLQPILHVDHMAEPRSNLAILIDSSLSMGLTDEHADEDYVAAVSDVAAVSGEAVPKTARHELVKGMLKNDGLGLLEDLRERYALQLFSFDKDLLPERIDALDELKQPDGTVTQLGAAFTSTQAHLRGLPLAGVVVFTDGVSNKGAEPELVAEQLGVPVYPVAIGAEEALDLKVLAVDVHELLFKDDKVAVHVTFAAAGLDVDEAEVTIKLGDRDVLSERIDIQAGTFSHPFVITPDEVGDLPLTVEVERLPEEQFTDNNSMTKRVKVIDSAIRILICVDTPSWEYRYLKGFLDTDERIKTKVFIRRGDLRKARNDERYLDAYPDYATLKRDYDCIILNNIGSDYFSLEQLEQLQTYVAEEGGSLIMISATKGTPGTYINTPVEEMLPVSLERVDEDPSLDMASTFAQPFALTLTRAGKRSPITRLHPVAEENEQLWTKLPPMYWYYTGIRRLKPHATALVEHASARNEYGSIPLFASHNYGRGQVLFLGTNNIWRWRFQLGNRYTNRYWGQTIQYLGLPHLIGNLKRVTFRTEGFDFVAGESIPITTRIVDFDYRPIDAESIELIATNEVNGDERITVVPVDPSQEGSFIGRLVLPEGTWTVVASGYEAENSVTLAVQEPRYEYAVTAMQKHRLEAIAQRSGGQYFTPATLRELPESIATNSAKVRRSRELPLWDTWAALILVCLVLGTEWIMRKRVDLP